MPTIGIIAEYNPFHSGHRHHIQTVRRAFGAGSAIVCAMSGNWVQRGQPALADKWTRAALALAQGVDLVLELPTLWAAASAEPFARGGVGLLAATGVVDILSFGSETGDLAPLQQAAHCLHSPAWKTELRRALDKGLSFPAARQAAATTLLGSAADCLGQPNNNLGVEYLLAIRTLGAKLTPHTIPRLGADHDQAERDETHASASYLREKLLAGDEDLSPYLSHHAQKLLRTDPADFAYCPRAVLARLRGMNDTDFARLPDCGEGLSNRLSAAVQTAASLDELYRQVQTKRYPLARIRRLILWAFLGLTAADRPAALPYLRVLGFTHRGQALLRQMKTTATLPVLVKPAHAVKLPAHAQQVFQLEARCTSLYDLCRRDFGKTAGKNEWTQNPVQRGL